MNILGIETSCDDTCIAIVKASKKGFKVLSSIISSQVKLHAKYGGVYPFLAKREHKKNLPLVYKKAIKKAKDPKIDLVAVTVGPGLEPCLWMGINFAQELAKKLKVEIVPVNHIEAHILANKLSVKNIVLPAICLVVSGGHTQLILMTKNKYKILGETRDDAAGECLDKAARILGLGYPGGPIIAAKAKRNPDVKIDLPRPMINHKNYDFSFSGLKTAILYKVEKDKNLKKKYLKEMCHEIQQAVIDVLIKKTTRAAKEYKAKTIIIGGGVTANKELKKQLAKATNLPLIVPNPRLSTDNAVMAAITAFLSKNNLPIEANGNLRLK